MEKEDFLLSQIDEFREKAKQLQDLLSAKETKVRELQGLVDERENKALRLQGILNERKQEAEKITKEIQVSIDDLITKVEHKIGELNESVHSQMEIQTEHNGTKFEHMEKDLEGMGKSLEDMKNELTNMKDNLIGQIHNENEKNYAQLKNIMSEYEDKIEELEELETSVASSKGYLRFISWFLIVNFIVVVVFFLYELGVFS